MVRSPVKQQHNFADKIGLEFITGSLHFIKADHHVGFYKFFILCHLFSILSLEFLDVVGFLVAFFIGQIKLVTNRQQQLFYSIYCTKNKPKVKKDKTCIL